MVILVPLVLLKLMLVRLVINYRDFVSLAMINKDGIRMLKLESVSVIPHIINKVTHANFVKMISLIVVNVMMLKLVLRARKLIILIQNLQIKDNANVLLAIKKFKMFVRYVILMSQVVKNAVIWILVLNVIKMLSLSKIQTQTINVAVWQLTI